MRKPTHSWLTSCLAAALLGVACGPCCAIEKHDSNKSAANGIPWAKDYAEAKKLAEAGKRPMIVFWTNAPDTASAHKEVPKWDVEGYLGRLQTNVFTQPTVLARKQEFVWVKIDYEKDAAANKELGIAENFTRADKKTYRPPARQGFVFARADGKIYGRLYCPLTETFEDMMEGVLKAHSPMDSPIRKVPYKTKMTYQPYKVPYKGRPQQLEFPPHTQTWHECPKCREALAKAMKFLKAKPNRDALCNFFAGFAFMMADGCKKELAQSIDIARGDCKPVWGGYASWGISQSMLLLTEYSIKHGLTSENRAALITAQQYAAEQVDDGGGWFHHPKQGGVNYAWDISMIGVMYYSAFLEMQALGLDAEPSLTLARGYLDRLSDGWSIGYGTPFKSGRWGSVGKNGLALMGFHAAGKQDDPFARMLGDFLMDNPDAPPKGHGTSWHHFFGAGMGDHLLGPAPYAKYAGYWLHPLIDCQKSDGSIAPLPHDNTEARGGLPPDKVLEPVMSSNDHNYAATAILACLILMTEPGAYSKAAATPGSATAAKGRSVADTKTGDAWTPSKARKTKSATDTPKNPAKRPR